MSDKKYTLIVCLDNGNRLKTKVNNLAVESVKNISIHANSTDQITLGDGDKDTEDGYFQIPIGKIQYIQIQTIAEEPPPVNEEEPPAII